MAYDIAQICLNGHITNDSVNRYPVDSKNYCDTCGSKTIKECQSCKVAIQGAMYSEYSYEALENPPSYCIHCGDAFPWINLALEAAEELANIIDELGEHDKKILTDSLAELVKDTPRREVAVIKVKSILKGLDSHFSDGFKNILYNVLSQPITEKIWGS
ncbi:hypothetical protein G3A_14315 [Bacillus sp. 17376]|nr:hypothetical protein G3A_14315 [Bacillus sp. 17376]